MTSYEPSLIFIGEFNHTSNQLRAQKARAGRQTAAPVILVVSLIKTENKMTPDFSNYTISELHESLSSLDKDKYPENEIEIQNQIQQRKEAGFVLSGENGDTTSNQHQISLTKVALPIWWRYTWRSTLVIVVTSFLFSLLISLLFGIIGIPEYMPYVVGASQLCFVPLAGLFFMRQAIMGKYKNFHLELTPKKANNAFNQDAKQHAPIN